MHKRKQILLPKMHNARMDTLNKLADLEKRLYLESVDSLTNEFFLVTRKFFKELFKIDYEFSIEELIGELSHEKLDHSLKMILTSFFKKVSDIRFSGREVSLAEFQSLIDEARSIVNMTTEKTDQEKELDMISHKEKEALHKLEGLDKTFGLISKAQSSMGTENYSDAKQSYFKIIEEYNKLPLAKKEKVYESIRRLYEEIKLLEKK